LIIKILQFEYCIGLLDQVISTDYAVFIIEQNAVLIIEIFAHWIFFQVSNLVLEQFRN